MDLTRIIRNHTHFQVSGDSLDVYEIQADCSEPSRAIYTEKQRQADISLEFESVRTYYYIERETSYLSKCKVENLAQDVKYDHIV